MSVEGSTALPHSTREWSKPTEDSQQLRRQILRFLVIGGASVVIDLCVYFLLLSTLQPAWAKGISYVVGMLFGFLGNKFWTFESQRKSLSEPIVYTLLYAFTLGVNIGVNAGSFSAAMHFVSAEQVSQLIAFFVATGTTTVLNFLGMKYLTFRSNHAN